MSEHTPGPWETFKDGDRFHVIRAGTLVYMNSSGSHCQADWIAEIDPDGTGHDAEQTAADACLIAAAPKLLAACKAMLCAVSPDEYLHATGMIDEAVQEAEGKPE